jgi:hypothetical protein
MCFFRLQTRTTYVQNSETELEQKRNHCTFIQPIFLLDISLQLTRTDINVVRAFESALNLLKAMGSGR